MHTEPWNLKFEPTVNEDADEEEYQRQLQEFEETFLRPIRFLNRNAGYLENKNIFELFTKQQINATKL